MRKNIDISVISIGKNCKASVENTIKSVLSQEAIGITYEYIIVDGLSTDGTLLEIQAHVQNNPCVRVISEADTGISDAMNKGVALASGQLIIHLHFGDLFVSKDVLKRVWNDYKKQNWSWAAGILIISKKTEHLRNIYFRPQRSENLLRKNCVPHQATFIQRRLFEKVGGFDVKLNQAMDYDLWLRMHFLYRERLHILNYPIAIFDSDGESSKIFELLRGNYLVRKKLHHDYKVKVSIFREFVFYARIIIYWLYYRTFVCLRGLF